VNGIRIEELSASDMFDVIHYFFEESVNFSTEEQSKAVDAVRTQIYRDLYNREYKYANKSSTSGFNTAGGGIDFDEPENADTPEEIKPFNPRAAKEPTKSYFPATQMSDDDDANPFGGVLDSPVS
jgi:hypothetical protein